MNRDTVNVASMETIERLVRGSIDMHIHAAPHPEPRPNALRVALQAQEAGMRAIVLKSRSYPTAPLASIVGLTAKDIAVFGGLCLNFEVGGLNPHAAETSAKLGAKVIWMPTFSAANHLKKHGQSGEGISILDDRGRILPVVRDILEIIKGWGMVLATGHLTSPEIFALVAEARQMGLPKIVITHAMEAVTGLTIEEQKSLASQGAIIEHIVVPCMPYFPLSRHYIGGFEPREIAAAIKAVGADRCLMSTDMGRAYEPSPVDGMRMFVAMMIGCGLSEEEVELMVKTVPAQLLALD